MSRIFDAISPPRRSGWPWGLIGALGLILPVERFVAGHDHDFTSTSALNWGYVRAAAVSEAPGNPILCVGSSHVKFGIAPVVIESGTGRRTYNLAACSGFMPVSYFVLRRALRSGARPTAVLVDCPDDPIVPSKPDGRDEGLRRNERLWPELLDLHETLDLACVSRDPEFLARTLLAWLSPTYKARFEIRANVSAALQGLSASSSWEGDLARRNWASNRGTHVMPRNPDFEAKHAGEVVQTPPQLPPPDGWSMNRLNLAYARRFLKLAEAHGVRVFWLIPPISASYQESRNRTGKDEQHTRFTRRVLADHPEVTVIDGRRSAYPAGAFWDTHHLNATGATAFSTDVSTVLRRSLGGPSPGHLWVMLPPYPEADPVRDSRLEDIAQSGKILKDGSRSR